VAGSILYCSTFTLDIQFLVVCQVNLFPIAIRKRFLLLKDLRVRLYANIVGQQSSYCLFVTVEMAWLSQLSDETMEIVCRCMGVLQCLHAVLLEHNRDLEQPSMIPLQNFGPALNIANASTHFAAWWRNYCNPVQWRSILPSLAIRPSFGACTLESLERLAWAFRSWRLYFARTVCSDCATSRYFSVMASCSSCSRYYCFKGRLNSRDWELECMGDCIYDARHMTCAGCD
jgi:hypothetical protein